MDDFVLCRESEVKLGTQKDSPTELPAERRFFVLKPDTRNLRLVRDLANRALYYPTLHAMAKPFLPIYGGLHFMAPLQRDIRVRVFFSSPGDVEEEREVVQEVIKQLQREYGDEEDIHLQYVGWETHTYPSLGRPQGEINEQVEPYEIFVGVFWNRYGSPIGEAQSGTVEEFERALDEHDEDGFPAVLFYFCQRAIPLETLEALEQKKKVVEFRNEYGPKAGLYDTYTDLREFERKLRRGLLEKVRDVRGQLMDEDEIHSEEVAELTSPTESSGDGSMTPKVFLDESLERVRTHFTDFADEFCRVHEDASIEVERQSEDTMAASLQIDGQTKNGCTIRKQQGDRDSAIVYTSGAMAASTLSRDPAFAKAQLTMENGRPGLDDQDFP
ncbi:DUF4062 domain-containing protein [Salinibacter ruber]|uniref:DUF4062 domain-containing protein n=1 Tax=Salinibacter ruber TaxID=146919 RepID=UPI00207332C9|nr:DUF4062 domain-containing protein [Salinibacter ruber]